MLKVQFPSDQAQSAMQDAQQAFYWSRAAGAILDKHGLAWGENRGGQPGRGIVLVMRGAGLPPAMPPATAPAIPPAMQADAAVFEGPVNGRVLAALGLDAEPREAEQVRMLDAAGTPLGELCYPAFTVRRIPADRATPSEPYGYIDADARWNNRTIRFQELKASQAWKTIAWMEADGDPKRLPAALTDGNRLVLGLPLLDLMAAACAVPALEAGFYFHEREPRLLGVERWLMERIEELGHAGGAVIPKRAACPAGFSGGLTIRHDYDRLIDDAALEDLLDFYQRRGIRSSWGFLVDKINVEHARRIASRGHEVNLHSVAATRDQFEDELRTLRGRTGLEIAGSTAHGGVGAAGFLGQTQYDWAIECGLRYGEMLGRCHGLPHAAVVIRNGRPQATELMIPPGHCSLDVNTKPQGHRLAELAAEIPRRLRDGQHVVLMNHPDVHQRELRELIDRLDLGCIWRCTFAEMAERFGRASEAAGPPAAARPVRSVVTR